MGRVSSLTLTDSGNYYTTPPTVVIDFPIPADSADACDCALRHDRN